MKKEVDILQVKKELRDKIISRYGSVADFVNSEAAKKFGGKKLRTYLYDSASVSLACLSPLCEHFGMGTLTRDHIVEHKTVYSLEK